MTKGYSIDKNKRNNVAKIKSQNTKGFKFSPKNKVKYGGIKVDEMVVINTSFIERILKRKIKKRLEMYLEYVISLTDDNNDTDGSKIQIAINDLERYKSMVKRKYRQYLDARYVELLLKKIDLIEYELKTKSYVYEYVEEEEYEEEKGRSR